MDKEKTPIEMEKVIPIKGKLLYEESPDFEDYYVHGAAGGINPYDIRIKFYRQDFDPLEKDRLVYEFKEGLLTEDDLSSQIIPVIREFVVGLTMSIRSAQELGHWLLRKVDEFHHNTNLEQEEKEKERKEQEGM
jgi:preprotein translocase subunit SecA